MSHNIIIINDRLDEIAGNATSGLAVSVRTQFNAAEAAYPNLTPKKQEKHEATSQALQDWLTVAGTSSGACSQLNTYLADYNSILS